MLRGGFLHTTSERGEGYIAYKRPKEKLGFKTPLADRVTGMLHNSSMKRLMRFAMAIKKGGKSLQERMDKEKKPYIFVGMVCVRKVSGGQGLYAKGHGHRLCRGRPPPCAGDLRDGRQVQVRQVCAFGMELAGTRDLGEFGKMYDLIKYPDAVPAEAKS